MGAIKGNGMRIGVNCQALGNWARHGFSTYLVNLLKSLRDSNPQHDFCEWVCRPGPGWRIPHQLWWDQLRIPWRAYRDRVDLIHTPAFSGPVLAPAPVVMTVMDLLYTRYPEWLPNRRARWFWGEWIPRTARCAAAVIVPSQATKQDLITMAGIPDKHIVVIPLAVDPHFSVRPTAEDVQAFRIAKGLTDPYLLYVGSIDRRKDWTGLLKAYGKVRTNLKILRLVIAGFLNPDRSNLVEEIRAQDLERSVVLPGHIPDAELPLLYCGAEAFVYPSWWEGFGLPPLEAMALGVPVVTYASSSLPEVVGDAAVLIAPPFTDGALANGMLRVLDDHAFRADLIARGTKRASEFSWNLAADRTMAVYEACVGNRSH